MCPSKYPAERPTTTFSAGIVAVALALAACSPVVAQMRPFANPIPSRNEGVAGTEHNLYEWSAIAPMVVAAEMVASDGRWAIVRVNRSIRGPLDAGDRVRIDLRGANRARTSQQEPLRLTTGASYVFLLDRHEKDDPTDDDRRRFRLVRGVAGALELPAEGAMATIGALVEFAEIQSLRDFEATWRLYRDLLGTRNPIVLETVLDQYLKFGRGEAGILPSVVPALDHPFASIRARAARLIGEVMAYADVESVDALVVRPELLARARRDPEVAVRVEATRALARWRDDRTVAILREIADSDPEQAVRYTAERLLLEHERARAGGD